MIDWDLWSRLASGELTLYFEWPQAYWFLGLWPLLWVVRAWQTRPSADDFSWLQQRQQSEFRHSLMDRFAPQSGASRPPRIWDLHLLRGALLLLAVTALAQPYYREAKPPEPQTKTVRDVVFVVESSVSMVLEDYQVEGQPARRIDVIRRVLDRFVAGLQGNRFATIVYADHAYTLMPLTSDETAARMMLKRLKPYLAGRNDVAAGAALGLALQQAQTPENGSDKAAGETPRKQVVVWLSDGQQMGTNVPLSDVSDYAQALGLPIYTVGVGAGSLDADLREHGGLLYQPLDPAPLETLAEATGGQYYRVGSGQDLQSVLRKIDQAEGVKVTETRAGFDKHWLTASVVGLWLMGLVVYLGWLVLRNLIGSKQQARQAVKSARPSMSFTQTEDAP
ncbi:vWA domain-containing protein [Hydrogenovibrio halophilus]|uniref:vWA domain-containing protein n=1 Tax=Hydrogenovibrio halophilus TaxID=373391 RepID=UPI000370216C|nr:VWA domain-containing protein [Hydrogenovibrio halophilus]